MREGTEQRNKDDRAANLLRQASEEIRQLRQIVHGQGAQLLVFEKLAKIAGWQDQPSGASPDLCWEIDRFISSMSVQEGE
jgi:hypothetical protein